MRASGAMTMPPPWRWSTTPRGARPRGSITTTSHGPQDIGGSDLYVIGGVFAGTRMPVSLFPHIDFPRVVVSIDAGDRDAQQMTAEITRPIEIALRAVPGVTRVRSTTSRGSAEVALGFDWATTLPDLPTGTRFDVRRSDPTIFPALGIALTSKTLDQTALRQIAELQVRPALTAVPGVAGVDILGGSPRELTVDVDPAKAQALGLSLDAIASALGKTNSVRGVGKIEDRHRLYLVLSENRLASIADTRQGRRRGWRRAGHAGSDFKHHAVGSAGIYPRDVGWAKRRARQHPSGAQRGYRAHRPGCRGAAQIGRPAA